MKAGIRVLFVLLLLCLGCTGCSRNKSVDEYSVCSTRDSYVYTSRTIDFFEQDFYITLTNVILYNDNYYVFAQKNCRDGGYNEVYCIDSEGSIISEYELNIDTNIYAGAIIEDDKIIYTTFSNKVEIYDMSSETIISCIQCDNNLSGVQKSADGYVVLAQGRIYKYNEDWGLEKIVTNDDWRYYRGTNLYYEENDKAYLLADEGTSWKYYEVDFENQTSRLIYNPNADNKRPWFCSWKYIFDEGGLCKYDFVDSTGVTLTNWNCMNLQPSQYYGCDPIYIAIDDNEFIQLYSYDNGIAQLVIYAYDSTLDYSDRTELTIGGFQCRYDISLNWAVYKFNTSQEDYHVVLDDYSNRFVWEDSQGAQNIQIELIQYFSEGNAPDIFYGYYFDYYSLADSGDVIDMYPYLADKVGEAGFSALSDSVEQLMVDSENHCYTVFSSYQMEGYAGLTSDIGTDTDWSIVELDALSNQFDLPLYSNEYATRLASNAIIYTINQEGGYSDEELSSVVNYAINYGIGDYSSYSNAFSDWTYGDSILRYGGAYSAFSWYDNELCYGGALTYIGYPSINGSVNVIRPYGQVAVSSTTEYPDACCDLVAMLWDYDVQTICATACLIPVNDECFRNSVYYNVDFNSIPEEDYVFSMYFAPIGEIPLDVAERYIDAVYGANAIVCHDWGIQAIVEDEVNQYFTQDKPIVEIVEIMQSRLSVYMSE